MKRELRKLAKQYNIAIDTKMTEQELNGLIKLAQEAEGARKEQAPEKVEEKLSIVAPVQRMVIKETKKYQLIGEGSKFTIQTKLGVTLSHFTDYAEAERHLNNLCRFGA